VAELEPNLRLLESFLKDLGESVKNFNQIDISEIKKIANPPLAVTEVMAAVMIYLGKGTSWKEILKEINDSKFYERLL
jgi:hypothetical protein